MTATTVNGLAVVADEPTQSPIKTRDGEPVLWVQTRQLLLEDGSVIYGCAHCDYTNVNPNGIRPHLNRHKERTSVSAGSKSMTLDQLLARVDNLKKVEADRDQWKARAVKAEKSLATLRDALKG